MRNTKHGGFVFALFAAITMVGAGCDDLLEVETPYTIAADAINPVDDAPAFSNSAWQNYTDALSESALYSGWFTNELRVGDTFPTRNEFGRRFIDDRNTNLSGDLWDDISRAVASAEDGLVLLEELGDADINITRLYLTSAFASLTMAETFCTGVIREGPGAETPELTRAEMLAHAIERFGQAISSGGSVGADAANMVTAARVGLARAHLFAGNNGQVAGAVAGVPADFVYNAVYVDDPGNRGRLGNTVYGYSGREAYRESGVVGPEWRALGAGVDATGTTFTGAELAGDARVSWRYEGRTAQDGVHAFVFQTAQDGFDAPIPVASGLEARYLVEQASGTDGSRLSLINERRTAAGLGTFSSADSDAILEELLHQKGRDFWLTGRRMPDWRWYTGDGATTRSTPFRFIIEPTDAYYKPEVGAMGDDVCWPLPYNEYSRNEYIDR